jgi:hypothetical protein
MPTSDKFYGSVSNRFLHVESFQLIDSEPLRIALPLIDGCWSPLISFRAAGIGRILKTAQQWNLAGKKCPDESPSEIKQTRFIWKFILAVLDAAVEGKTVDMTNVYSHLLDAESDAEKTYYVIPDWVSDGLFPLD